MNAIFRAGLFLIGLSFHTLLMKWISSSPSNPMLWGSETWTPAIFFFVMMGAFLALALRQEKA